MKAPPRLVLASALALACPCSGQYFDWDTAHTKAAAAVAKLTAQEKIDMVTGVGWGTAPCVGNTKAVPSIGYPALCLQDSPLGVRFATNATAFTPGIQAAATWDKALLRQRGALLGLEAKGVGVHNLLAPVAGPLGAKAAGGRNWEGFGADPYLSGIAMQQTIIGLQGSGVQATAKHFILNEQELNRETMSSRVDDRTMHELYLWPFADAVYAGVAAVMCSHNKVNGTWACENEAVMNKLLKKELGFQGYVMSDWNAQHSTVQSAVTGLDMTMPGSNVTGGNVYWGPSLADALASGAVPERRLDDMAARVLAGWFLVKQDAPGYPAAVDLHADVQANHRENVRAVARDGIVLLQNRGAALPLKTRTADNNNNNNNKKPPARLALIGSAAAGNPQGGPNACFDRSCNAGALGMGWGSGTAEYPYFVAPADALRARAAADGTALALSSSDDAAAGAAAARGADVAIVVVTADSGEEYITVEGVHGDRADLDPWHGGNALVRAVAEANANTIVVVQSVGPVVLETIVALPGVQAIVWAGLGSQENGNALVDVLYGLTSPSGKLPYTIAKAQKDYPSQIAKGDDGFAEGLFIDYRHFDHAKITPRYEFGFGLSYSSFTYSGLQISSKPAKSGPATGKTVPGGRSDLFDNAATITATITNTGSVTAAEVAQLYISLPAGVPSSPSPPRQLRGFDKIALAPGASGTVTFSLRRRDISYWDVVSQNWIVPKGTFEVNIAASSRDLRLKGKIKVP